MATTEFIEQTYVRLCPVCEVSENGKNGKMYKHEEIESCNEIQICDSCGYKVVSPSKVNNPFLPRG